MSWESILVPAASGLTGAALTQGVAWWREARKGSKARKYWALRIALMFERFAMACAYQKEEGSLYQQSGGHEGTLHSVLPILEELPADADWQGFDQRLTTMILHFPLELEETKRGIEFRTGMGDHDDAMEYCDKCIGERGRQALQIADGLRQRYRLASVGLNLDWDFRETLRKDEANQ